MTEIKLLLTDPRGYAAALEAASKVWGGPDETTLQIDALRGMILDQLPAIEEPLAFASVVKVRSGELWVRLGAAQSLPWGSGEAMRSWSQLDVIEVLRVGVGEPQAAEPTAPELAAEAAHAGVANSVTLRDHYSATISLRIAELQPQYNLVQLNAHRGASNELISCDVNRGDFLDAVEKVLNVRVVAP